jgi:hypothetical protein
VKGRTWGPSSVKNERHQRTSVIFADGRWSKSAPNLERSLKNLGHSNSGALNSLCKTLLGVVKCVKCRGAWKMGLTTSTVHQEILQQNSKFDTEI